MSEETRGRLERSAVGLTEALVKWVATMAGEILALGTEVEELKRRLNDLEHKNQGRGGEE